MANRPIVIRLKGPKKGAPAKTVRFSNDTNMNEQQDSEAVTRSSSSELSNIESEPEMYKKKSIREREIEGEIATRSSSSELSDIEDDHGVYNKKATPDRATTTHSTSTVLSDIASDDIAPVKKKLKIKLKRSPTAVTTTTTTAAVPANVVSPSSNEDEGDTIAVQQKMQTVEIDDDDDDDDSPLSDLEQIEKEVDEGRKQTSASSAGTNRPWGREGKAPVRDSVDDADAGEEEFEMIDAEEAADEEVDEGSVDYAEDTGHDDIIPYEANDADEVISISSQDDEPLPFGMQEKPWMVAGFNDGMRMQWETMYCTVEMRPLINSWEITEDYQKEKDKEMLRYMEDYPLPTWVIPKENAEQAYFRLLERSRWRSLGIRIYGNQRIPEIIPNATPFRAVGQFPQQQMPLNIPQAGLPHQQFQQRQPSMSGSRPPSTPQQFGPHGPPPGMHPQHSMPPPGMHHPLPQPPPGHVLRSQPNAMPMNVPPGPHGHPQHQQMMMQGPPPPGMQMMPMSHMPHGLPYAVPPHMMSHVNVPMHAPRPMPYGMQPPPGMQPMPQIMPVAATRAPRKKKETPAPPTPPPPPPTPPYDVRERPVPRKEFNKTGKRNMRKQAEALEFPWHRKLDYYKLRADAKWDDAGYEQEVLDGMAAARQQNMPIINKLDDELTEKQRNQRNKRKKGKDADDDQSSDAERRLQPEGEEQKQRRKNANIGGDPYYSGNFSFASEADRQKALALQRKTPDDIIDAAEAGKIDWDLCKEIFICWNPGKKGLTQDLVQAKFRIFDTLITRKQLETTPILTRRAAECIVDFCPDMLWRETLLRIVSEAGYGNKDVRDRFCYNGCHNDKATITKRIAAALGQKQINAPRRNKRKQAEQQQLASDAAMSGAEGSSVPPMGGAGKRKRGPQPKEGSDRYHPGEQEWHDANKADFNNYIRFFGKRPGTRVWHAGDKRKKSEEAEDEGGEGDGAAGGDGRAKSETVDVDMESGEENAAVEEESESEEESGDEDEVVVVDDAGSELTELTEDEED